MNIYNSSENTSPKEGEKERQNPPSYTVCDVTGNTYFPDFLALGYVPRTYSNEYTHSLKNINIPMISMVRSLSCVTNDFCPDKKTKISEFTIYECRDITDISTYSITFLSDRERETKVTVTKASVGYILLCKSDEYPNHLAIGFENAFLIKHSGEDIQKGFLVLHGWFTPQNKAVMKAEFFDSMKDIETHLLKKCKYSFELFEAGKSYTGFQAFSRVLSQVENKNFIYDTPLTRKVEEARNDFSFTNCKRIAKMICDLFKLELTDLIKEKFLNAKCFLPYKKKIEENGWVTNELLWKYA